MVEERNPHLYNGRGRCLDALGRLGDAITSFRHAVALDGSFMDMRPHPSAGSLAERWIDAYGFLDTLTADLI
jgi:hypothetical protein